MDVLSDVLNTARLCGSVFFTAEVSAPGALESPNRNLLADVVAPAAEHVSLFQILTRGECVVECDGCTPVWMDTGDLRLPGCRPIVDCVVGPTIRQDAATARHGLRDHA